MSGVIRLAERRGIFQRRTLSRVQDWCVKLSLAMDAERSRQADLARTYDLVRASLVGRVPYMETDLLRSEIQRLFPEFFEEEGDEVVVIDEITEEELEDTTGAWDFSQATVSEEEISEVLAALGQTMKVEWADVEEVEDDGGWV